MTQIFQILAFSLNLQAAPAQAQITTCDWPHKCAAVEIVEPVAQFQTCQWPHTCVQAEAAPVEPVAQFQTCQWPHTCVAGRERI